MFQMLDQELYKPVKFKKFKKILQPYFNQVSDMTNNNAYFCV